MAGIFHYKFDLQLLLIPTTEIMTQVNTVTLRSLGKRSWSHTRAFPGFSPGTKPVGGGGEAPWEIKNKPVKTI